MQAAQRHQRAHQVSHNLVSTPSPPHPACTCTRVECTKDKPATNSLQHDRKQQAVQQTSLRSDIGGDCSAFWLLLPVAESAETLSADRFAALLGDPSRKNAEGEKLPGVRPAADGASSVRHTAGREKHGAHALAARICPLPAQETGARTMEGKWCAAFDPRVQEGRRQAPAVLPGGGGCAKAGLLDRRRNSLGHAKD